MPPEDGRGGLVTGYVCGSRGSAPVSGPEFREFGGATTCYILRDGDYAVVLDCGTGFQHAGPILAGCRAVDVLLTHVHYDHILGFLWTGAFPAGVRPRILSGFGRWFGEDTLARFLSPPFWPVTPDFGELVTVRPPERFPLRNGFSAEFIDASHPNGGLLTRLTRGERKLCFLWDHEDGTVPVSDWVRGSELLCWDGMFDEDEYPSHVGWGHSTWQAGCRLARECGVGRLLITHHAPGHDDAWLRRAEERARALFPNTRFAREGDVIEFGEESGHRA